MPQAMVVQTESCASWLRWATRLPTEEKSTASAVYVAPNTTREPRPRRSNSGQNTSVIPAMPMSEPAVMRAVIGVPKTQAQPEHAEERARRIPDRDEAGHDVLLGVVHEDVAHAEHRHALERHPQVLARRISQAQAAHGAVTEDDEGSEQEAIEDARLGRDASQLERDRKPRRAPDRRGGDEQLQVGQLKLDPRLRGDDDSKITCPSSFCQPDLVEDERVGECNLA
jgi:hypothetical protein